MIYIIIYLYVIGALSTLIIEYPRSFVYWVIILSWFIAIPIIVIWTILKKEQ